MPDWPWLIIASEMSEAGLWVGFTDVGSLHCTGGGVHASYPYCHYDWASLDVPFDRRIAPMLRSKGYNIYEEPDSLTRRSHTHITLYGHGTSPRMFSPANPGPANLSDVDPSWAIYESPPFGAQVPPIPSKVTEGDEEMAESVWIEPGGRDVLHFDRGRATPSGGKEQSFNTYLKAWSPTGKVNVHFDIHSMDGGGAVKLGQGDLTSGPDPAQIPEANLDAFIEARFPGFHAGLAFCQNNGAGRVKLVARTYQGGI